LAGLVRNAHKGEGLGNQFLARIREVDALLHVVRCFDHHGEVPHVEGSVDPVRDIGIVETELLLADLATVERARAQVVPRARAGGPCLEAVAQHAAREGAAAVGISGRLEMELAELPDEEAGQFLTPLGIAERALPRLIHACESLLCLRTFFSIASAEVRAWPV